MRSLRGLIRQGSGRRPTLRGLVCAVLALAGVATVAMGLARLEVQTTLASFVPENEQSLQAYADLGDTFGAEPIVVLIEADSGEPVLSSERAEELLFLEGELAALPGVASVYGPTTTLNQMAGQAKDLLAELSGRRDAEIAKAKATARQAGRSPAQVRAAAKAAEGRFDARYGSLVVSGMQGGLPTLRNQQFIDSVVFGSEGLPRARWRSIVPRRDVAAVYVRPTVDPTGAEAGKLVDLVRGVVAKRTPDGTTVTVTGTAAVVSGLSDRATADAPILAALAVGGLALCFLLASWLAWRRRWVPLGVTLVSLATSLSVFGWLDRPLTLGMVAFCPVLLGIGAYYPTYVLTGASRWTVAVVGTASAASLATLVFSPLPLVADIGLLLGLGVLVCLVMSLALAWLLASKPGAVEPEGDRAPAASEVPPGQTRSSTPARTVLALVAALSVWGWILLPNIPISTDVEHFAGGLSELEDAQHAEGILGSGGEVDLVLSGIDTLTPESLAWMRKVDDHLAREHGDLLHEVLAPHEIFRFLGDDPTQEQIDAAVRLIPPYLLRAVVAPDRSQALLAHGIRMDDVVEFGEIRHELAAELPAPPPGYEVDMVGLPLVLVDAEELVSSDRGSASLIGIGVAGLILLLGLRRRGDAVRALAAALIASGIGFWLLDITGRGFDPVTVALGTLTIAVGAEFTVVQCEATRSGSRALARTVGLVAATSAVGYLALLGSGLSVVRGFGIDLAGTVALAYVISRLVVAASVRQVRGGEGSVAQAASRDLRPTDVPELEEASRA